MCQIEKRLHKVVPAMIDLFVTPLVSVFVTGYLTLAVIGPIFTTLEDGIINGVQALIQLPFGIGSFIMGGLYAVTVVAGIHHMYTLIDLGQLAKFGFTYWLPLASAANVAQAVPLLPLPSRARAPKLSLWPCPPPFLPAWALPSPPSSASTCATLSPLSAVWSAVLWRFVCQCDRPWCHRHRRDRHLRHPAASAHAAAVPHHDGNFLRRFLRCDLGDLDPRSRGSQSLMFSPLNQ